MIDRRQFLKKAAVISSLAPVFQLSLNLPSVATQIEVGDWTVETLSDGHLTLPLSFLFPTVPKDEITELLRQHGLPTDNLMPPLNVTIASRGEKRILFDVGSGSNFMPTAGKLLETLEHAGLDPSSITDIVFTHAHPDHLWGLLDDFDELTFPDANYYFPRLEWEFWRSDAAMGRMSEGRETFVVGAQSRMKLIEDRVQLIDEGSEPLSGVEAFATYGHTPGHMAYVIHGGADTLTVIGDALTNHVISFTHPEWESGSDLDTQMGIATRKRLLDRMVQEQSQIIGYHLPNGGIGRVDRNGPAFKFVS